jgi:formate/nitrite transporter FocA (FNT family)
MGYSLVAMAMLRRFLPDAPWRPLVVNLGYSVGFLIVILGRQQLFTENTLTPVLPLLHNRDGATLLRVLRLWGVVLASNVAGALIFAAVVAHTPAFRPEMRTAFQEIATDAMEGSAAVHMVRAIFSGWLIALMVWLLPNAETARVFIVVMLTYVIGVAGLSHVIAGSVETLYGVMTGVVSIPSWLGRFFLPVLVGNMIGGMALVASFTHAEIAAETGDREMEPTERRIQGSATSDRPRPRRAPDGA